MAQMCVAGSVLTAMMSPACPLAHASMPHAAKRALATCDPRACAGAELFDLRRATTATRCQPSRSTPTTRGRRRRRRARRGYRRCTASSCFVAAPTACWLCRPVSAFNGGWRPPMARGRWYQCCGRPASHFGLCWCSLSGLTRAVPKRTFGDVTDVTDVCNSLRIIWIDSRAVSKCIDAMHACGNALGASGSRYGNRACTAQKTDPVAPEVTQDDSNFSRSDGCAAGRAVGRGRAF